MDGTPSPSAASARRPVFRFAPSPNGALHLGHAFSALINEEQAMKTGGRLLLRIEDIDTARCTAPLEAAMIDDLAWLGIGFERPYRRQSDHFDAYRKALHRLDKAGLVYPAFLSRSEIKTRVADAEAHAGTPYPRDPDGAPLYPGNERHWPRDRQQTAMAGDRPYALRLDMARALTHLDQPLFWRETGAGPDGQSGAIAATPAAWGDVVLARRDAPTSYHLAVTVDDALQGVTHVTRGMDLFHATSVHRLLQALLGLPAPVYHHHRLILGEDGRKLSKSLGSTALRSLRDHGTTPEAVRRQLGFA